MPKSGGVFKVPRVQYNTVRHCTFECNALLEDQSAACFDSVFRVSFIATGSFSANRRNLVEIAVDATRNVRHQMGQGLQCRFVGVSLSTVYSTAVTQCHSGLDVRCTTSSFSARFRSLNITRYFIVAISSFDERFYFRKTFAARWLVSEQKPSPSW